MLSLIRVKVLFSFKFEKQIINWIQAFPRQFPLRGYAMPFTIGGNIVRHSALIVFVLFAPVFLSLFFQRHLDRLSKWSAQHLSMHRSFLRIKSGARWMETFANLPSLHIIKCQIESFAANGTISMRRHGATQSTWLCVFVCVHQHPFLWVQAHNINRFSIDDFEWWIYSMEILFAQL